MMYVISKATFGSYNVRDIQFNVNWTSCPYSDYASIPENMVDGILATKGYCDITLNSAGTEVVSYKARSIPSVPEECCGTNTVLSVNGVTANTSGELTLEPDNIGAAPGGFGLGRQVTMATEKTLTDANDATLSGWYRMVVETTNGIESIATMRVDAYGSTNIVQTAYKHNRSDILQVMRRSCLNGTWGEWEWVNPPMLLGAEYRTTGRWEGRPIYTKYMALGGVSDGGTKTTTHNIDNIDYAIRATFFDAQGTLNDIATSLRFTQTDISIALPSGVGGNTVYAILEYVKTPEVT